MSASEITEIVVGVMILIGALLNMLGTVGLIRFPDIYNRTHAATKSATLGVMFVLAGATFFFWLLDGVVQTKLILGIVFVFLTAPVAGHLIARAAYRSKVPLWQHSVEDDLEKYLNEEDYRKNTSE